LLAGLLTEAARAAQADTRSILESAAGCTPYPQPLLLALNVLHTIEIRPDAVTNGIDWMSAARTISGSPPRSHADGSLRGGVAERITDCCPPAP